MPTFLGLGFVSRESAFKHGKISFLCYTACKKHVLPVQRKFTFQLLFSLDFITTVSVGILHEL